MDGRLKLAILDAAMFFVFIVEISKLLKTGDGFVEFARFDGGQACAQDGSGMHRVGLWARLTAWVRAQGVRGADGA